ncbi:hypothetical protein PFWH6_0592 [Pseudomonas fluorescens WH6]|nr:hypothetical protein PFWH6_0592 [Pseudomonas fluorescens WH6]
MGISDISYTCSGFRVQALAQPIISLCAVFNPLRRSS